MQPHKVTLAVTNVDGDVFKMFRVERDKIPSIAATWECGIKALHERKPHEPDDPVHHACDLLRDMMDDDLPTDPFMGTAAVKDREAANDRRLLVVHRRTGRSDYVAPRASERVEGRPQDYRRVAQGHDRYTAP